MREAIPEVMPEVIRDELLGGCLCGAVRYRIREVKDAGFCHCWTCRKATGSAMGVWAHIQAAHLALTQGEPAAYRAGDGTTRYFCGICGSPLYVVHAGSEALMHVHAGTLDAPGRIRPDLHRSVDEQLPWLKLDDYLPTAEGGDLPPPSDRKRSRGAANPAITRDTALRFCEVTKDNLDEILLLQVTGPQSRYVATNAKSLAQAQFQEDTWKRAIYADDTAVGFVMVTLVDEDYQDLKFLGQPYLWRFLIDERYQGLGLGKRALSMTIAEVKTWGAPPALWLSVVKGAGSAYDFYRALGFVDTGVVIEREVVMRRDLTATEPAASS